MMGFWKLLCSIWASKNNCCDCSWNFSEIFKKTFHETLLIPVHSVARGNHNSNINEEFHGYFTQGIHAIVGDDDRRGSGKSVDWGPPPPTRSLEEDVGVLPRSHESCPAVRSIHTQGDHGGAQGAIPCLTPLEGENSHIHPALPNLWLCTYREGGQVGGKETIGTPVGRPLPDAHRAPPGVDIGA